MMNEIVDMIVNNQRTGIPTFVMMVGIQGAGKTSIAEAIKLKVESRNKENKIIILSSDALRREICGVEEDQSKNDLVFAEMRKRSLEAILKGWSVIYDATNITVKNRKGILTTLKTLKEKTPIVLQTIAYVVNESINICLSRNAKRERKVPEDVIYKFLHRFQIPIYQEGFDYILFYHTKSYEIKKKYQSIIDFRHNVWELVNQLLNFPQNNPHHDFSLFIHSMKVYEYLSSKIDKNNDVLLTAGLLHDYGKLLTKVPNKKNPQISSYYGHANVGTYELMTKLDMLGIRSLEEIVMCLALINYHMDVFNWHLEDQEFIEKKIKFLGSFFINNLLLLHDADEKNSSFFY